MTTDRNDDISFLRRIWAYWWYMWGMSLCYWGLRTHEREFFRAGVGSYERATRTWPAFSMAHLRRGVILSRELGEHGQGIAAITRAIEITPSGAESYLQRGLIQRFHGNPNAALMDLRHYLALGGEPTWRVEAERQIRMIQEELES